MSGKRYHTRGINVLEVNSAREAHAKTVHARLPGAQQQRPDLAGRPMEEMSSPSSSSHTAVARRPGASRHICNNPNNPPCAHCGTTIIPSPRATLPLEDNPSISIDNWTISTRKRPILNSQELEDWENNRLKGLTLPEMIFGNNYVRIDNTSDHWSLEFNALDALRQVKLEDSGIRVSYSQKWINSKQQRQRRQADNGGFDIEESSLRIARHYDWTYTTKYKGTETGSHCLQRDDEERLPLKELARPDNILFYDDMILFEDELADNGISMLNVKIRVMEERLLILSRFFLRVDDVLIRVADTRVCVEFAENKVIREFKEFEGAYKDIICRHKVSHSHDPKAALRDSNWVVQNTPLISRQCESLKF
ncbi:TIP41 (YPR040W) [Zygosaccharomyces parabailii]|nr:TIP41 (YPR040W) [Zygosaccharomyces parabailii]CDH16523.1 probable Type 2A phosphatase activator TIP41 [Zygosaccharomyces bailii ISA1307]